jgi:hypothetical protein
MFNKLTSRYRQLSRSRLLTKYCIYFFLALLTVVLLAQLLSQLYTVNQLKKVSGVVSSFDVELTSHTAERYSKAVYSRIITLQNKIAYSLPGTSDVVKGDTITLYYPPRLYQLLTLNILDYEKYPVQIAVNGSTITSFSATKLQTWKFIGYLLAAIGLFAYFLYDWHRTQ